MKSLVKALLIYTLMMLAAMFLFIFLYSRIVIKVEQVGQYDSAELEIYMRVWNNINNNLRQCYRQTMNYVSIFWFVLLILGYIFITVTYMIWVKPVKQMQNYASEIAKGNLDVPLPMNRNKDLTGFTESFDLMREELKIAKAREIEAEYAKREMIAELSHDLKTPVATIQATCEVLEVQLQKGNIDADDLNEKVGYISTKANTINELVQNVLHAAIDDMDEVKVFVEEESSQTIEDYFKTLTEYGKIILDNHIPECLLYFDKLRMEQVVDNIVGNSYKYAGTDIHVRFNEIESPSSDGKGNQKFIKITIRDSGPGVPESELPLIVEKYYRGKDSKENYGYGLGLYLANIYMERQNGGMEYYNDDGFVVELLVRKV